MGLLDKISTKVSGAVSTVKDTAQAAVTRMEKVATSSVQTAKDAGHAAASHFDPRPSAPTPRASAPVSGNSTVPASAPGLRASLDAAIGKGAAANAIGLNGVQDTAPADTRAKALIANRTSWGNLDEAGLAKDMAELAKRDPVGNASTLKAVMNQLPKSDRDDVAQQFAQEANMKKDELARLALVPDGKEALEAMSKELKSGWTTTEIRGDNGTSETERAKAIDAAIKLTDPTVPGGTNPETGLPEKSERQKFLARDKDAAAIAGNLGSKPDTIAANAAARANYDANGNTAYDLSDPAQAQKLIENSPQIDNNPDTKTDPWRCSGAATLNAMLLAGKPADNADAIAKTASGLQPPMNASERSALEAMRKGSMTPQNAAHAQELLTRMAVRKHGGDGGGIKPTAVADFARELRSNGAFANAKNVAFHAENGHWTVNVTRKDNTSVSANSNPNAEGKSAVGSAPPRKSDAVDLIIENRDDGQVEYKVDRHERGEVDQRSSGPRDPKAPWDFPRFLDKQSQPD